MSTDQEIRAALEGIAASRTKEEIERDKAITEYLNRYDDRAWITPDGRWKVIDGDTIEDLWNPHLPPFRLSGAGKAGFDSPETAHHFYGKHIDEPGGRRARKVLYDMLSNNPDAIHYEILGKDSHGSRALADLYINGESWAQYAVKHNLATRVGKYGDKHYLKNAEHYANTHLPDADAYSKADLNDTRHYLDSQWDYTGKGGSTFGRSLRRGIDQSNLSYHQAANALGRVLSDLTGVDSFRQWGEEGMAENLKKVLRNPPRIQGWDDIKTYSDVGTLLLEGLGENAHQWLFDAGLALTTGVVSMAGRAAVAKAVENQVGKKAFNEISKQAMSKGPMTRAQAAATTRAGNTAAADAVLAHQMQQKAAQRSMTESLAAGPLTGAALREAQEKALRAPATEAFKRGAKGAALGSLYAQAVGEADQELTSQGIDAPASSFVAGAGMAALDWFSLEKAILEPLFDKAKRAVIEGAGQQKLRYYVARAAKDAAKHGLVGFTAEAITESMQEMMAKFNAQLNGGEDAFTPEQWENYLFIAAKAGPVGGSMSMGSSLLGSRLSPEYNAAAAKAQRQASNLASGPAGNGRMILGYSDDAEGYVSSSVQPVAGRHITNTGSDTPTTALAERKVNEKGKPRIDPLSNGETFEAPQMPEKKPPVPVDPTANRVAGQGQAVSGKDALERVVGPAGPLDNVASSKVSAKPQSGYRETVDSDGYRLQPVTPVAADGSKVKQHQPARKPVSNRRVRPAYSERLPKPKPLNEFRDLEQTGTLKSFRVGWETLKDPKNFPYVWNLIQRVFDGYESGSFNARYAESDSDRWPYLLHSALQGLGGGHERLSSVRSYVKESLTPLGYTAQEQAYISRVLFELSEAKSTYDKEKAEHLQRAKYLYELLPADDAPQDSSAPVAKTLAQRQVNKPVPDKRFRERFGAAGEYSIQSVSSVTRPQAKLLAQQDRNFSAAIKDLMSRSVNKEGNTPPASEDIKVRKDGQPYVSERAAKAQATIATKNTGVAYEVVRVAGGFGIRPVRSEGKSARPPSGVPKEPRTLPAAGPVQSVEQGGPVTQTQQRNSKGRSGPGPQSRSMDGLVLHPDGTPYPFKPTEATVQQRLAELHPEVDPEGQPYFPYSIEKFDNGYGIRDLSQRPQGSARPDREKTVTGEDRATKGETASDHQGRAGVSERQAAETKQRGTGEKGAGSTFGDLRQFYRSVQEAYKKQGTSAQAFVRQYTRDLESLPVDAPYARMQQFLDNYDPETSAPMEKNAFVVYTTMLLRGFNEQQALAFVYAYLEQVAGESADQTKQPLVDLTGMQELFDRRYDADLDQQEGADLFAETSAQYDDGLRVGEDGLVRRDESFRSHLKQFAQYQLPRLKELQRELDDIHRLFPVNEGHIVEVGEQFRTLQLAPAYEGKPYEGKRVFPSQQAAEQHLQHLDAAGRVEQDVKYEVVKHAEGIYTFDQYDLPDQITAQPKLPTPFLGTTNPARAVTLGLKKAFDRAAVTMRTINKAERVYLSRIGRGKRERVDDEPVLVHYGNGQNPELSNLAFRPFAFDIDSTQKRGFVSVEHAYQSLKSGAFDQRTYSNYLQALADAAAKRYQLDKPSLYAQVKAESRKAQPTFAMFHQLVRDGFAMPQMKGTKPVAKDSNVKLMNDLVQTSFAANPRARQKLLATKYGEFHHPVRDSFWRKEFPKALEKARFELRREYELRKLMAMEPIDPQARRRFTPKLRLPDLTSLGRALEHDQDERVKIDHYTSAFFSALGHVIDRAEYLVELQDNQQQQVLTRDGKLVQRPRQVGEWIEGLTNNSIIAIENGREYTLGDFLRFHYLLQQVPALVQEYHQLANKMLAQLPAVNSQEVYREAKQSLLAQLAHMDGRTKQGKAFKQLRQFISKLNLLADYPKQDLTQQAEAVRAQMAALAKDDRPAQVGKLAQSVGRMVKGAKTLDQQLDAIKPPAKPAPKQAPYRLANELHQLQKTLTSLAEREAGVTYSDALSALRQPDRHLGELLAARDNKVLGTVKLDRDLRARVRQQKNKLASVSAELTQLAANKPSLLQARVQREKVLSEQEMLQQLRGSTQLTASDKAEQVQRMEERVATLTREFKANSAEVKALLQQHLDLQELLEQLLHRHSAVELRLLDNIDRALRKHPAFTEALQEEITRLTDELRFEIVHREKYLAEPQYGDYPAFIFRQSALGTQQQKADRKRLQVIRSRLNQVMMLGDMNELLKRVTGDGYQDFRLNDSPDVSKVELQREEIGHGETAKENAESRRFDENGTGLAGSLEKKPDNWQLYQVDTQTMLVNADAVYQPLIAGADIDPLTGNKAWHEVIGSQQVDPQRLLGVQKTVASGRLQVVGLDQQQGRIKAFVQAVQSKLGARHPVLVLSLAAAGKVKHGLVRQALIAVGNGKEGAHVPMFDGNGQPYSVIVLSESLRGAQMFYVLAHELGHAMQHTFISSASAAQREAVLAAYRAVRAQGDTRSLYEWLADKVAGELYDKVLANTVQPAPNDPKSKEGVFRRLGNMLLSLYQQAANYIKQRFAPDRAVSTVLNDLAVRRVFAGRWHFSSSQSVEFSTATTAQARPVMTRLKRLGQAVVNGKNLLYKTGTFLYTVDRQMRDLGSKAGELMDHWHQDPGKAKPMVNLASGERQKADYFTGTFNDRGRYLEELAHVEVDGVKFAEMFGKEGALFQRWSPYEKPLAQYQEDIKAGTKELHAEVADPKTRFARMVRQFLKNYYQGYLKPNLPTLGFLDRYFPFTMDVDQLVRDQDGAIRIFTKYRKDHLSKQLALKFESRMNQPFLSERDKERLQKQYESSLVNLMAGVEEEARRVIERIIKGHGVLELAIALEDSTLGPGFSARHARDYFNIPGFKEELANKDYMERDAMKVLYNYVTTSTKRVNFEKHFAGYKSLEGTIYKPDFDQPPKAKELAMAKAGQDQLLMQYAFNVGRLPVQKDRTSGITYLEAVDMVFRMQYLLRNRSPSNDKQSTFLLNKLMQWEESLSLSQYSSWYDLQTIIFGSADSGHFYEQIRDLLTRQGYIREGNNGEIQVHSATEGLQRHFAAIYNESGEQAMKSAQGDVRAMLGQIGSDMPREVQSAMSTMMAYQSVTVLAFSTLSSLVEPLGAIFRNRDLGGMWSSLGKMASLIGSATLNSPEWRELTEQARFRGIISQRMTQDVLQQTIGTTYQSKKAQKILDHLFYFNGQEWFTNATRVLSYGIAKHSIERWVTLAERGDPKAQQYLNDLRLDVATYRRWDGERPTLAMERQLAADPDNDTLRQQYDTRLAVHLAHVKFVDESAVRPNAAQRPRWGSDPRFMLLWHLKQFFYSYGKMIVLPFINHMQEQIAAAGRGKQGVERIALYGKQVAVQALPFALAGLMMFGLSAAGWELREAIQYRLFGKKTRSSKMKPGEYSLEVLSRAGVWGPYDYAASLFDSTGGADARLAYMAGPTADWFYNWVNPDTTFSNKVFRSTPILNQLPGAKDQLRELAKAAAN